MMEKEYFAQIKTIRKHIAGNRLKRAKRLLDEMYSYKPVRLLWFVARAEYLLKAENDPDIALKSLEGKYLSGADYPGMDECMKLRLKALKQAGRDQDAVRENYCYQKTRGKSCDTLERTLEDALEHFAENAEDTDALAALAKAFYHVSDMVSYFIARRELLHRGCQEGFLEDARVAQIANFGYLEEQIVSSRENTFILVMDRNSDRTLEILGHLLHCLGHRVFLLSPPLTFETEGQLDLEDTLDVSWDQLEQYPDMCVIPPVALEERGAVYGDNRGYIIDRICREESGRDNAVLLCSGNLLEQLYGKGKLKGRIGRLSPYETDIQEEYVQFGWVGDYLSYISDLYGYDVRRDIDAEPEVDFSILIPARNSAATLRYTLETCLKQSYSGSYEIVVSDNSIDNETSIYDLCQELNDSRIRYVRTPRILSLPKSFEFGYLQTRGKFVLSMGSDDGMLPWGLETLQHILERFPETDIVVWERGFYAWPGFNGGQENQLIIPRKYLKNDIPAGYVSTEDIFEGLAKDPQMIYTMPLLYINSGFRRRYLRVMLEKTGKLWDGGNQDICTGVMNCCINDQILQAIYPITIAGMSSGSIGYLMNIAGSGTKQDDDDDTRAYKRMFQWDNVGTPIPLSRERLVRVSGLDLGSLYYALSRAVEEGLISEHDADAVIDWSKVVSHTLSSRYVLNDAYDACIHWEQVVAKKADAQGTQDAQAVFQGAFVPRYIDESAYALQRKQKSYIEGPTPEGGEILDASKYGVHNIAEAAELFAQKTGLQ